MMAAWLPAQSQLEPKLEFYPEAVAHVPVSSRARERLNAVVRSCLCCLAWVDRVCLFFFVSGGCFGVVWSPATQKRQQKAGTRIPSGLKTGNKVPSIYSLEKWQCRLFLRVVLLLSTKREPPCRLAFLPPTADCYLVFCDRCREGYQGIRCDQFLPKTDSILSDPSKLSNPRHKSSVTYEKQKQTGGKWKDHHSKTSLMIFDMWTFAFSSADPL